MFAVVDVCYDEQRSVARAACVLFADPQSDAVTEEAVTTITPIADYEPGHFYRRELPCIEAVLAPRLAGLDAVLIDAYVYLSNDGRRGLGWHVHECFTIPVIGVAKTRFHHAETFADLVCRGESRQPLYVTQVGYQASAADLVRQMHGRYRVPTLLKRVDQLARSGG